MKKRSPQIFQQIRFKFTIPIYEVPILFAITNDVATTVASLPKNLRESVYSTYGDDLKCAGMYASSDNVYAIIINSDCADMGTIDHEIGHVCRLIMENIGYKITAKKDEPLAYLEGWVTKYVHRKLTR